MGENNVGFLIGIAGFAVVCAGLLFVALLIVLRVTGRSAMSFLSLFIRGSMQDKGEDEISYIPRPQPNLRQIADSVDFDAAVAKNVVEQEEFGKSAAPAPGAQAQAGDDWQDLNTPSLERAQRLSGTQSLKRRPKDYDNDEIFGGLLDDDGDGNVDH
jgi:hypothetical protein